MEYNGTRWEIGITWNTTTGSDSQYTTDNRFNFYFTGSSTPWSPSTDITTVAAWIDASDSSNYTRSGTSLTSVTDKS